MKLMKAPRQVSSHAQTIKFADGTNVMYVRRFSAWQCLCSAVYDARYTYNDRFNITTKQTCREVVQKNLHVVMDASR